MNNSALYVSVTSYLMFDYLPQSQIEIHMTFPKELQVVTSCGRSLTLNPIGQFKLNPARLKAHRPHWRSGGCHLNPLQQKIILNKSKKSARVT